MAGVGAEEFRQFFEARQLHERTLRIDCAWVKRQPPGSAALIMKSVEVIEEYLRHVRKESDGSEERRS